MGTDDKLIYNVIFNSEKWKLKEFSIQAKSLILDLYNILYLDINHAGFVLRCYICNHQKPLPAIETLSTTSALIPALPLDVWNVAMLF